MKSKENLVGAYAVLIGVIIAVLFGIFQIGFIGARQALFYLILAVLGLIIGFASVSTDSKEAMTFLLASVSLVIVGSLGQEALGVGEFGIRFATILDTLLIMFVPATIVVALKTVFSVATTR